VTETEREHLFRQLDMTVVPCVHGGEFAMHIPVGPHLTNIRGGLQGGLVATLADVVGGIHIYNALPTGQSSATSDLTVHFLSAVTVGPAHAEATIRRQGNHTAVVEVAVWDEGRDVLAAICTMSFAVLALRDGQWDPKTDPSHRLGSPDTP
jgi:uncharacterized protein (TIGR00369 family)